MAHKTTITITSPDGSQNRGFTRSRDGVSGWVPGFTYGKDRFGGYGACTIPTTIDYRAATAIQVGDRVEIKLDSQLRYRGYIADFLPSGDEPRTLTLQVFGVFTLLRKIDCDQLYAFPGGSIDISLAFSRFAQEHLLNAVGVGGNRLIQSVQSFPVGTTISALDGLVKTAGDVFDLFIKESGNLAVIGCDVDPEGNDRLYIRLVAPLSPPTWAIPVPGAGLVEKYFGEKRTSDVVNRVYVFGGNPQYAQKALNGGFGRPVYQQDGSGNLVRNGGFESNSVDSGGTDYWSCNSGASIKKTFYNSPSHGVPFAGDFCAEADHVGENFTQTTNATFVTGNNYVFSIRCTKEIVAQTVSGTGSLKLYSGANGTGTLLATVTLATLAPVDQTWAYYSKTFVAPAGAISFVITLSCDAITAVSGNQGGLLFDDAQLYNTSVVYQESWETRTVGSGVVNIVNWVYQDYVFQGAYSVYLDATGADSPSQDVKLVLTPEARFSVKPGDSLRYSAMLKSPPSSTNPNPPKFYLEFTWYDSSGKIIQTDRSAAQTPGFLSDWTYYELIGVAPNNASVGEVSLSWRSAGSLLIDAVSVRNSVAATVESSYFLPDGPLKYLIKANDPYLHTRYLPSLPGGFDPRPPGSAITGPAGAPTVANAPAGTYFIGGARSVGYTYVTGGGESQISPLASVTLVYGDEINVSAITLPGGVTGLRYYVSIAPGSSILVYAGTGTGGAISLTTFPTLADYFWSEARYGPRTGDPVSDSGIIDLNSVLAVAVSEFTAKAAMIYRPSVTVLDDARPFECGDSLLLIGRDGPSICPAARSIVQERGSGDSDGILRRTLSTEMEPPGDAIVIKKIALDVIRKNGPGSGGGGMGPGGYTNPTGGGVTSAPPVASSTVSGTVKTTADHADPVVYERTEADTLLSGKISVGAVASGDLTGTLPGPNVVNASDTVYGRSKLSVAPVSPTAPIAVGDNDSRMTNARTPTGSVSTSAPLTGGGLLSTSPMIAIPAATTSVDGYLSHTDWNIFNGKGTGTVTSVGVTAPAEITVTGSPVTTSGTINLAWAAKAANLVFAGPSSGAAATPAFRALVAADIPNLPASQITTGLLALARGGANADLSATGGANQVVQQTSAGGALTVGTLDAASIASGTMATARLGSGVASSSTFLRGDQTYAAISASALLEAGVFGDGTSGAITYSGSQSLTNNVYATSITVNGGVTLNTAGYKIFCTGTLTNNGIITNSGAVGANASGGTGGTGGVGPTANDLGGGGAGGAGAAGIVNTSNTAGIAGTNAPAFTGMGSAGGGGGNGGLVGIFSGGGGGTSTITQRRIRWLTQHFLFGTTLLGGGQGGGGGGSGASGGASGTSGAGGQGGAGGGVVYIATATLTNNGTISSNGGNGGNGGNGSGISAESGGGPGGGGGGGLVYLVYNTITVGTINVNGGATGSVGTATSGGASGVAGASGTAGLILRYNGTAHAFE